MTNVNSIAIFAERHSVPVEYAYILPSLFTQIADIWGTHENAVINAATYTNSGLAEYIVSVLPEIHEEMTC